MADARTVERVRELLEQGHGSIINTVSGAMVGLPFTSAYGASKGGVKSYQRRIVSKAETESILITLSGEVDHQSGGLSGVKGRSKN